MDRGIKLTKYLSAVAIIAVIIFALLATISFFDKTGGQYVQIKRQSGILAPNISVSVRIANTEAEREAGLSGTEPLSLKEGMLFVFEKEGIYGFWMKDMNYPIDIVWISQDKKIIHIEKNIIPETYPEIFRPSSSALYVLELSSGFCQKYGIKIGDTVKIPQIK